MVFEPDIFTRFGRNSRPSDKTASHSSPAYTKTIQSIIIYMKPGYIFFQPLPSLHFSILFPTPIRHMYTFLYFDAFARSSRFHSQYQIYSKCISKRFARKLGSGEGGRRGSKNEKKNPHAYRSFGAIKVVE